MQIMKERVVRRIDLNTASIDQLHQVATCVRNGGLVVVPTDTVYGVACDPMNAQAIEALYKVKDRPESKPLQILVSHVSDLQQLGLVLPSPLDLLSERFLPGPFSPIAIADDSCKLLTLHEEQQHGLPPRASQTGLTLTNQTRQTAMIRTQAIRIPQCAALLNLLAITGPLAASSANKSGQESVATVDGAYCQLAESVDWYCDSGSTHSTIASTVVAYDAQAPYCVNIVREGGISAQQMYSVLSNP